MIPAILAIALGSLLAIPAIYWVATTAFGRLVGYGLAGAWLLQYGSGWTHAKA